MRRRANGLMALLLACALGLPALAPAQSLEKSIQRERQRADERKSAVQKLSEHEKALAGRIAEVEKRAGAAEQRIRTQEAELDVIRREEAVYTERYDVVRVRREQAVRELRRLLDHLWPLHAQGMHEGAKLTETWDASDRRFQWTSSVYAQVRAKLEDVRRQERELSDVLAKQKELAERVDKQLAVINKDKDALLRDRLSLVQRQGMVTAQRRDLEGELQDILKTIQQLNYQLASQRTRKFDAYKSALPWPVAGKVVAGFAPDGRPARRGLGIATAEGAEVRSVFWGKVVHNDTLRGLGKVVIVFHGNDYYSLYAYLAESEVQAGQEVEKDEPIGRAGYYPEARGTGTYFELRFRQKPINPLLWLTPAK